MNPLMDGGTDSGDAAADVATEAGGG